MGSRDEKKLQVFVQHASGVSRALWPANVRRSMVTGKVAQRRRSLIARGRWWTTAVERYLRALAIVSLLLGGTMIVTVIEHLWYLFWLCVVLGALLAMLVLAGVRFKRGEYRDSGERLGNSQRGGERRRVGTGRAGRRGRYYIGFRLGRLGKGVIRGAFLRAPETPIPGKTPLIRVLETFDLSQTGVEHFLDADAGEDTAGETLEVPVWSKEEVIGHRAETMRISERVER